MVPWLASAGELAYSPASPPTRDYFFQYSWIIPGIFHPTINKRQHYWFGSPRKDRPEVGLLFRFWNQARAGIYNALFVSNGVPDASADVTAPVAVYRHADVSPSGIRKDRLVVMQHGSYHIGDVDTQPLVDRGEAFLYRGIQHTGTYLLHRLSTGELRTRLMQVHAGSLTDSVDSFNAAHCNLVRCETELYNDRTFVLDSLARKAGLDPETPSLQSVLYSGYTLDEWCAAWKFGPNYVKFRTPFTNLRFTAFPCGESEVKVIDPNKLEVVETHGCNVREVATSCTGSPTAPPSHPTPRSPAEYP